MAIHYTCRCGANIRMPRNVAGRKARCNSCGYIFTVPAADINPDSGKFPSIPLEPDPPVTRAVSPATQDQRESGEVGDWLGEFAQQESTASAASSAADTAGEEARPRPPATLLDFADKEDILAPPARLPGRPRGLSGTSQADEERSGVIAPTRSYWTDLLSSFVFFLDGPSLVTFVIIVMINLWTIPLSYAGILGMAGLFIVSGYLCTFYMAVIKETAAGEDELPNIWIDDIYSDLLFSVFRFAGTWLWVLIPAIVFAVVEYVNLGRLDTNIVFLLAVIGLFFWPVVILGVALGGSFHGLWPHTIILTALVAPLPYLAMCGVLLVAAGITIAPSTAWFNDAVSAASTATNRSFFWTVTVINSGISAYAMIVAMRAVGLYYRHYKQKFPWVAE